MSGVKIAWVHSRRIGKTGENGVNVVSEFGERVTPSAVTDVFTLVSAVSSGAPQDLICHKYIKNTPDCA